MATKVSSYDLEEANNLMVIDPKSFARQAVHIIGKFRISTGSFIHDLQVLLNLYFNINNLDSFWYIN